MRSPGSPVAPGRRARAIGLAGALGLSVVAGACGSDSDPKPAATAAPRTTSITIEDFSFGPQPLELPKGSVVTVTNMDDAVHTATADDDSFDTGELGKGESKDITLSEEGEIAFHCHIHDYMTGVIRVTA